MPPTCHCGLLVTKCLCLRTGMGPGLRCPPLRLSPHVLEAGTGNVLLIRGIISCRWYILVQDGVRTLQYDRERL